MRRCLRVLACLVIACPLVFAWPAEPALAQGTDEDFCTVADGFVVRIHIRENQPELISVRRGGSCGSEQIPREERLHPEPGPVTHVCLADGGLVLRIVSRGSQLQSVTVRKGNSCPAPQGA